jgi:hypothetical protein
MSKGNLLRIVLCLCLGLMISGCKVITETSPDCPTCPICAADETVSTLLETPEPSGIGPATPKNALTKAAAKPSFLPQDASPVYLSNFFPLACSWHGVGGQVFDAQGKPMQNMVVTVGGWLSGVAVNKVSMTGTSPAFGPGGYEVHLGTQPVTSFNSLWIQVSNLSGEVLSQPLRFSTYADCDRNLIIINFVQELPYKLYVFPIMK